MNSVSLTASLLIVLLAVDPVFAQPKSSLFSSDSMLVFVPFTDRSGFSGQWNLSLDVPRFAAAYAQQRFRTGVVSPLSVRSFAASRSMDTTALTLIDNMKMIAEHFHARFIVAAEIREFSISRFIVSEVQLAGYEAFSAEVKIHFSLYDAAQFGTARTPVVYEGEAEGVVKERGLGVTLFGKRTDQGNKYFSLDEIAFGSETFVSTIIGDAMLKCMDDLGGKLERSIPSLVSRNVVLSSSVIIDSSKTDPSIAISRRLVNGEIVMVDDDDVFVNLGSTDGIVLGDILPVYDGESPVKDAASGALLGSRESKVGEVQVIEIRAEHLSLAVIVNGKGAISAKQRVRKVFVR